MEGLNSKNNYIEGGGFSQIILYYNFLVNNLI